MKKITLLYLMAGLCLLQLSAQQTPRYTNYLFNAVYANPAVVGTNGYTNVITSYRTQWTGIDKAPQSFGASVDGSIANGLLGLGLSFNNDVLGALDLQTVNLNASYIIPTGDGSSLSLGVGVGVASHQLDLSDIANAGLLNDPAVSNDESSFVEPDLRVGAFFQARSFFAAFSILNITNQDAAGNGIYQGVDYGNHYYTTIGAIAALSTDISLKPSVQLRSSSQGRTEVDLTGQLMFYEKFSIGPSLKFDATRSRLESVSMFLDYYLADNFRVLYAYDVTTSELSSVAGGSHEIGLGFRIMNRKRVIPMAVHTRHFHN